MLKNTHKKSSEGDSPKYISDQQTQNAKKTNHTVIKTISRYYNDKTN